MTHDLLGDPVPDSLPANVQFTDVDDLKGHKIVAMIDYPDGRLRADMVIVTETGCWLALQAESAADCCDGAEINVIEARSYGNSQYALSDYVSAFALFREGVINQGEYEILLAKERERQERSNAETAARLRAQLAALEKG